MPRVLRAPRIPSVLLAFAIAIAFLGIPVGPTAPGPVRAALPDLTVVSTARYDVQPGQQRVRVTVDLTLTNRLKDTTTRLFYFDHALFDVLPGASGFAVTTEAAGRPTVRAVSTTKDYTRLRIDLGTRLRSGKSAVYRLVFYLRDPGGAPTRDLRIGDSLVSFPVWAFASDETPGSSVTVVFPAGYQVEVEAGSIPPPTHGRRRPDDLPLRQARQAARHSSRTSSATAPARTRIRRSRPRSSMKPSRSTSGHGPTILHGRSASAAS